MSDYCPRIRIYSQRGYFLARDGLNIVFYMQRAHREIAPAILRALDIYRAALPVHALGLYTDEEGDWQKLDEKGWAYTRRELLANHHLIFHLADEASAEQRYGFQYHGKTFKDPILPQDVNAASTVSFWLPTRFLEEHGPERVHKLALELAASLPFTSGHAGLSFNGDAELVMVLRELRGLCFRYPGMDILPVHTTSQSIGSRLRGPSWMTFLGPPVLEELGGAEALRGRLHSAGTTVQELGPERAVITLGPWPDSGDMEEGRTLPAYRELARVIAPWLYHQPYQDDEAFTAEDWLSWERRFLDG